MTSARGNAWIARPDVVTRRLGDTLVLVCLTSNRIFELNRTGARIWELVAEGRTLDQVADTLAHEFDVQPDTAHEEIVELRDRLVDAGLIEAQDAR